jgi:hypothetical protein
MWQRGGLRPRFEVGEERLPVLLHRRVEDGLFSPMALVVGFAFAAPRGRVLVSPAHFGSSAVTPRRLRACLASSMRFRSAEVAWVLRRPIAEGVVAASLGHESSTTTMQSYVKPEAAARAQQRRVLRLLEEAVSPPEFENDSPANRFKRPSRK